MKKSILKIRVQKLRKTGFTFAEIQSRLKLKIPKATLSLWCQNIHLTSVQNKRILKIQNKNLLRARNVSVLIRQKDRKMYLTSIYQENDNLPLLLNDMAVAKIVLATLYAAEGTKGDRAALTFGNSNPDIIKLFLKLLRFCYAIDESKFRCTLQCRADSPVKTLERFWSGTTQIPLRQFYQARIDARTIGKKTQKPNYKGVCRLDYLSAHLYNELIIIANLLYKAKGR